MLMEPISTSWRAVSSAPGIVPRRPDRTDVRAGTKILFAA